MYMLCAICHRVHNRQEGSGLAQFGNIFLPFACIIHSCFLAVNVLMLYFMTCTGRPGMCNMSCFGLLCTGIPTAGEHCHKKSVGVNKYYNHGNFRVKSLESKLKGQ